MDLSAGNRTKTVTAWVLGDQLSFDNPVLEGADRVLLIQSTAALSAKRFHRQKLHLILVAMRRFSEALAARGFAVDYVRADTLAEGLAAHQAEHAPDRVRLLSPNSAAGRRRLGALPRVELVPGSLFVTDPEEFAHWAADRRRLVMEDFYRSQRRRFNVLMDDGEPCGGRWNFDADNRQRPPKDRRPPRPYQPREDAIDDAVRGELDELELDTWGEDGPRLWPADHDQARRVLKHFIEHSLSEFGPYQDVMLGGERILWHSQLSSSLNLGLISPLECVRAAEAAYRNGSAPLQSVEGFVRQIIGWREYVWCMYWHVGGRWQRMNALSAQSALPAVLETGETQMRCLADAVGGLRRTAYAHHIERLMLFGNLVLLTGVHPQAARDWFHRAFIDGYDWVMAPNVLGMATWADGGEMMTKPYAASGRYIDRMSDHCRGCQYQPGVRTGDDACPFTTLYWDFLARNRERLSQTRRMQMPLKNLERIEPDELAEIRRRARSLRRNFDA
jgi:deoxyribodipyrimidine photolyase-related protein